ncbi:hypothetical protein JKP88DRAFT_276148 [Tribonema minus]|uniref:Uncharacterized protein n=1 Tax=Tribonema minus TaxID=303371 RepID=A0A835Z613_9STRA|nr:hypothetical protein JKP88DRAFT_276148 [Tribonema minus]
MSAITTDQAEPTAEELVELFDDILHTIRLDDGDCDCGSFDHLIQQLSEMQDGDVRDLLRRQPSCGFEPGFGYVDYEVVQQEHMAQILGEGYKTQPSTPERPGTPALSPRPSFYIGCDAEDLVA